MDTSVACLSKEKILVMGLTACFHPAFNTPLQKILTTREAGSRFGESMLTIVYHAVFRQVLRHIILDNPLPESTLI